MAKVLVVIPHDRFRDEEFVAVYNALKESGHEINIGSSHHTEAQGNFGLVIKPDVNIRFIERSDYDAMVFIGGHGIEEYITDTDILNMIRNFFYDKKLIAAIGMAVELLAYAGIISGRKVTCDPNTIAAVQGSGAYYTGKIAEIDGDILTASGVDGKDEFAKSIVKALNYLDPRRGLR